MRTGLRFRVVFVIAAVFGWPGFALVWTGNFLIGVANRIAMLVIPTAPPPPGENVKAIRDRDRERMRAGLRRIH